MIQDVDDTLRELLVQKTPLDKAMVDIQFEMPSKDWSAGVSRPTVNLYLYDVRENHELRSNQHTLSRAGGIGSERRAPVRVDLSYLITVWSADISDEHQLLGRMLTTLLRYPVLPEEVLRGSMTAQPLPLLAWIAQPERNPNPWDLWGTIDNRMKAGLNYVVTASLEPYPAQEVLLVRSATVNVEKTRT